MKTREKVGWRLAGLLTGVVVAALTVFALYGTAAFFSGGLMEGPDRQQAAFSR